MSRGFLWGRWTESGELTAVAARNICLKAERLRSRTAGRPTWKTLELLHKTGRLWEGEGSPYRQRALKLLKKNGSFSVRMNADTLDLLPGLFNQDFLTARLRTELGRADALESWALGSGEAEHALRAFPLGAVLTVAAGNIFLGCIDSVVMSLMTGNVALLRVSSADREFPLLFAESLLEAAPELACCLAVFWWDNGRKDVEKEFKTRLQGIAVWGGQEAINSYRHDLGPGCRLLDFGPRLSFGVLTQAGLRRIGTRQAARRAARDAALWDQSACASPQTLFVEGKSERFLDMLGEELSRIERDLPPGRPRPDEAVQTLERRQSALVRSLLGKGRLLSSALGQAWTVDYEPRGGIKTSPLRRYINVVSFKNLKDLSIQIEKAAPYLQSAGLLAGPGEENLFETALAGLGVTRIPELGSMLESEAGEPHDGRYPLRELVRWVCAPSRAACAADEDALRSLLELARGRSPYYRRRLRPGPAGLRLSRAPLLTKEDVYANTPPRSARLLTGPVEESSLVFASGGSTGRPKFCFHTKDEFDLTGRWLGWGLRRAGLEEGDVVANLFVAGNLWSSFLAVTRALENIKVTHLPIGGTTEPAQVLEYLKLFKADVLIGLPSTILELCRKVEAGAETPTVKKIFYAGEHVSPEARRHWRRVLGARLVRSAGYASVDAGLIGYSCPRTQGGEHHAATGLQKVEIIGGEIVVTNLKRRWMPIIRYRTGDLGRWVDRPCPCGDPAPKFELLGRCDDRVNVGGAHLDLGDISRAVAACRGLSFFHQIVLERAGPRERLRLKVERSSAKNGKASPAAALRAALLKHSAELRDSVSRGWLQEPVIEILAPGALPRQARTGKLRRVLDLR